MRLSEVCGYIPRADGTSKVYRSGVSLFPYGLLKVDKVGVDQFRRVGSTVDTLTTSGGLLGSGTWSTNVTVFSCLGSLL